MKGRRLVRQGVLYLMAAVAAVWALFPVYWIAASSIRPQYEIVQTPLRYLPQRLTFDSYKTALGDAGFTRAVGNTVKVASVTTLLSLLAGALAGYAFARF